LNELLGPSLLVLEVASDLHREIWSDHNANLVRAAALEVAPRLRADLTGACTECNAQARLSTEIYPGRNTLARRNCSEQMREPGAEDHHALDR